MVGLDPSERWGCCVPTLQAVSCSALSVIAVVSSLLSSYIDHFLHVTLKGPIKWAFTIAILRTVMLITTCNKYYN